MNSREPAMKMAEHKPDSSSGHLTEETLIRHLDGELHGRELMAVQTHLAVCDPCRQKAASVNDLSSDLEYLVASTPFDPMVSARERLAGELSYRSTVKDNSPSVDRVLRHFGWAVAAAAIVAVCLLTFGNSFWQRKPAAPIPVERAASNALATLEVDGESFIALPYSNEDLPSNVPHVVQMQVPVASLASAGITLEPVASGLGSSDRTVLADVLLGVDGQPLGFHLLSVN